MAVGFGAALGVDAILSAAEGSSSTNVSFVILIERIFGLWALAVGWLLWRGHIKSSEMRINI